MTTNVVVDTTTILKQYVTRPGICVNTYADLDVRRPPSAKSMKSVVTDLNPGFVRILDGFNLDETGLFLPPDYTTPGAGVFVSGWNMYPSNDPRLVDPVKSPDGITRQTMLLDDLIDLVPKGTPVLCGIAFNPLYATIKPGTNYVASRETLLAHANALIRHNIVANLGITHYEIGNETIGYVHNAVAIAPNLETYIPDVQQFADFIKGADPKAQVGVNAMSVAQFKAITENVSNVDFLVNHNYAPYGNPNTYPQYASLGNAFALFALTGFAVEGKRAAIVSPGIKANLQIITTETSAIDFSPNPYPRDNNLGLGIMMFDLLGQHVANLDVNGVTVWNTRGFVEGKDGLPHVLKPTNDLTPLGHGLSIWSKNMPDGCALVSARRDLSGTFVYAAANTTNTTLWLVNKRTTSVNANLAINASNCSSYEIMGGGVYTDLSLTRKRYPLPSFTQSNGNLLTVMSLPPVSINVLQFGGYMSVWAPTANVIVSKQPIASLIKPGVSMNVFMDNDLNRPNGSITFNNAMKDLSPASIKYPGGRNCVGFSWAPAPYTTPNAVLTRISSQDFPSNSATFYTTPGVPGGSLINPVQYDDFLNTCLFANSSAIVQTDIDTLALPNYGTAPTQSTIVSSTQGLATYTAPMGINTTWEIGYRPSGLSSAVNAVSNGIKAITSNVIVCNDPTSWALANVDYTGISNYYNFQPTTLSGNYTGYVANPYYDTFSTTFTDYSGGIPVARIRSSKPVAITETGAASQGWTTNDGAKMVYTFDLIGGQLTKGVQYLSFLSTRSFTGTDDIFNNDNTLTPIGWAVKAWTSGYDVLGGGTFTAVYIDQPGVVAYSGTNGIKSVVWMANETRDPAPFRMFLDNANPVISITKITGEQGSSSVITGPATFTQRGKWITGVAEAFTIYTIVV